MCFPGLFCFSCKAEVFLWCRKAGEGGGRRPVFGNVCCMIFLGGFQGRGQRNTSGWSFRSQAGQSNQYKNARTAEPIYFQKINTVIFAF